MTDYIQLYPHQSSTRWLKPQHLILHCNTDVYEESFFVSTAKLWNNLSCDCLLLVGPQLRGMLRFQLMGEDQKHLMTQILTYEIGTLLEFSARRSDQPTRYNYTYKLQADRTLTQHFKFNFYCCSFHITNPISI